VASAVITTVGTPIIFALCARFVATSVSLQLADLAVREAVATFGKTREELTMGMQSLRVHVSCRHRFRTNTRVDLN
jgi:hypothetical protein